MTKITVRSSFAGAPHLLASSCPGANSSADRDEQRCNNKERTFQRVRCRSVPNEAPNDVVGLDQISEKRRSNNELMNQKLVSIFEVGCIHRRRTRKTVRAFARRKCGHEGCSYEPTGCPTLLRFWERVGSFPITPPN